MLKYVQLLHFKNVLVVQIILICTYNQCVNSYSSEMIHFQNLNTCNKSEYYSVNNLRCGYCDPTKNIIPSPDSKISFIFIDLVLMLSIICLLDGS